MFAARVVTGNDDSCVSFFSIWHENIQDFFKTMVDCTTVVVVRFVAGFFVAANLALLDSTVVRSLASIERSVALRFRAPSTISAGFSPGLLVGLGLLGVIVYECGTA